MVATLSPIEQRQGASGDHLPELFKMRICIGIVQINTKSIAIRQVNITVSSVSPYSSNTPASKSYEVVGSANADASIGTR